MKLKIITIILLLAISNLFGKSTNDISMLTEQYPPYNMMIDGKLADTSIEVLDALISKWQKPLDEIKSNGSYAKIMKK